ncbi:hypothetical protein EZV62_011941 [Acer yangbiense]|uniref:Serine/threonine-protein kinase ATR n=1 Tax=Acer yangbiense TaxID=1000413 RepID=A0A5C7I728_9ROSI|nr:hypothetical protein EZV62_011941 [Acer yangbiense]
MHLHREQEGALVSESYCDFEGCGGPEQAKNRGVAFPQDELPRHAGAMGAESAFRGRDADIEIMIIRILSVILNKILTALFDYNRLRMGFVIFLSCYLRLGMGVGAQWGGGGYIRLLILSAFVSSFLTIIFCPDNKVDMESWNMAQLAQFWLPQNDYPDRTLEEVVSPILFGVDLRYESLIGLVFRFDRPLARPKFAVSFGSQPLCLFGHGIGLLVLVCTCAGVFGKKNNSQIDRVWGQTLAKSPTKGLMRQLGFYYTPYVDLFLVLVWSCQALVAVGFSPVTCFSTTVCGYVTDSRSDTEILTENAIPISPMVNQKSRSNMKESIHIDHHRIIRNEPQLLRLHLAILDVCIYNISVSRDNVEEQIEKKLFANDFKRLLMTFIELKKSTKDSEILYTEYYGEVLTILQFVFYKTPKTNNLSSLVHELRERIAWKVKDDFKQKLFIYYLLFIFKSSSAVLPVIGRILPFFAEPAFCICNRFVELVCVCSLVSRHGVIFETVQSLLSLLQCRLLYQIISSTMESDGLTLNKCLTDGTLYVEGLPVFSCLLALLFCCLLMLGIFFRNLKTVELEKKGMSMICMHGSPGYVSSFMKSFRFCFLAPFYLRLILSKIKDFSKFKPRKHLCLYVCQHNNVKYSGQRWLYQRELLHRDMQCECVCYFYNYFSLTIIFLLYNDHENSSEEVQLACVGVIRRILVHGTGDDLTRTEWIKCIEYLLLNKRKAVREAFCTQISSFVQDTMLICLFSGGNASDKTNEQKFLNIIKHALAAADDPQILETLLESTAEVMMAVDIHSHLFLFSLILLVEQLDNPHITVRMNASRLIQKSCSFHLKGGFEAQISKVVHIRNELFDYLTKRISSRPKMVREFAEAVFGVETEQFVKKMIPVVLPKLVVSQQDNDQAVDILNDLAKCLNTDTEHMVVEWLPKVLAFALHQSDEDLLSTLNFYCAHTGSDNREIFAAALPGGLLDELVCFLDGGDSDEISKRLVQVPQIIKKIAVVLTGSEDLPGFLRNHFVGLLNSIDKKMLHSTDFLRQKQALKRIEMLIKMMGSHLSTYVPKVMVLLMRAIRKESLQCEGLSVLHFFIEQLARVSPSSTKHIISQVFAALIPFLERDKKISPLLLNQVVKILEDLVLKNRAILKQHIHEFPLLPTIPALKEVNKAIQESRGSMTLKDQLRDAVDGLNHENLNVRYMVVCELSKLLKLRREDVTALINCEAGSDMDVLSSLISSLLRGCAEESRTSVGQRLNLACADCLGALGAVDPAKVKVFSCQRFKIECSDDDLIFELIHKHLARAFRSAPDTVIQDSAALAIQELLKIAGCEASLDENVAVSVSKTQVLKDKEPLEVATSGSKSIVSTREINMRGQRLWDRFSNYVKEIIAPCLTSRFQLPNVSDLPSAGPIYQPSMLFREWIFSWIKTLTAHATGSRASIFYSCRGIVRHDMQTAVYLLPYLVLNAVCHGEVARGSIAEEILSVLNAAAAENSWPAVHGVSGQQSEVCIQTIFTLLDNLGQWVDDVEQELALSKALQSSASKQQASKSKNSSPTALSDQNQLLIQCKYVSELLTVIPKVTLARASFSCQAYARALMYFESHVRGKSGSFNPAAEKSGIFEDEDVSFLMEIYSCLDEPDGLSGLAFLRKSLSSQDELIINKKSGNWAEVLTSCEQALQMEPKSVQRHSDVLNCLLNMCHLQAMVTHVDGLISRIPQYKKTWCMQGVQAAWRLGRWNLMDEYLSGADEEGLLCSSSESNASFDMDVAKILQAMMKKDHSSVGLQIGKSKQDLIAPLAAAGMDSYMRAYPFIVKLNLLQELEDFDALLDNASFLEKSFYTSDLKFREVMEYWENRLRFTQPSLWAREPLLAFRRLVFGASGLGAQVGNCWIQYAKLCRMAGHYETANRAILEAQASGAPNVHMEKAKLLWSTKRSDGAIAELQQCLLNMPVEVVGSATISSISSLSLVPLNSPPLLCDTQALNEKQDIARTLLLYSRWIHYTGQKQKEDVIVLYSRVRELQPTWEKGYFYMAKYCDEVLVDARKRQEENSELGPSVMPSTSVIVASANSNTEKRWWCNLPDVLLFYAKGLHRGHKNLFQALPRLLTLWFDFGSMYQRSGLSSNKDLKHINGKVMSIIRGCLKDLPTYQWLTVLPQLVSRICHQNEEIVRLVKHIITSVLRQYPQQGLWIMAAVSKSTVPSRREAAAEIIQAARKGFGQGNSGNNLFGQFASLIDHLIKLCFHPGQPKSRTINISTEFSALKRMMPLGIIMPTQQSLTVSLPMYDANLPESLSSDIFSASDLPTISGIADEAEILSSLQRPKKIVLLGSDGIERPFLCKPKDDLRKDARMMEFTAMINRLLSKYPESRRRKLYIRTFAVIPLTEDCGMVEWVPHTRGLRHILQDIYISCGKFDRQKTNPQIKRTYDQCQGKMAEDVMLKTKILPMFPPVFHKWFLTTFSEPAAWFRARIAFAHTTAVWSMVGHIVGLGDRHGENILFDSTTGDCVHVDFSCLFDKGLLLEKPELVPFRLTQNMIDGLGITGYEGVFLRVCEITLSVLRTHRETLMSVLETFIHDPLVEWTKSHKSSGVEVQNPHAQRAISNIEARLQGVVVGVGAAPSLPLAVEGQARRLIAEAVSHRNLGKMYIWWMPWF